MTAIEIRRQREHSHTRYSPRDSVRRPQPLSETHLKEAIHPIRRGGHDLPSPRERSPQGRPSAYCYPNNGRIMEKTE